MEVRTMLADDLARIRDIDRTEEIRIGYRQEGTELIEMSVDWDDAGWREGDGEHSFGEMIRGADHYLSLGGTAIGAFDGDRLAGIAIYRPRLTESMGQLALLHVSSGHRRSGIASLLFAEVLALAQSDGATALYVSATPSESAVGFYHRQGFSPTDKPDPALLAEEPEDIHMTLDLDAQLGETP
ncbi:MAG: GNAT family N-acetyltransferase [Candidatus Bipolaricaulia bacterium]